MKWLIRSLIGVAVLGALAFAGFQAFKPQLAERAFSRAVSEAISGGDEARADGLHVFMCGTGSPMADNLRAGPCIAVLAGDQGFIFDVGGGSMRKLGRMGFAMPSLEKVYLTHLHSDHIDGLGELYVNAWVAGERDTPLPVAGPVGTQEVINGLNMAYRIDSTFRIAHHGPVVANPAGFGAIAEELVLPAGPSAAQVVHDAGGVQITAIRMQHAPVEPAFGYRIDFGGRSISISGDTVFHPGFVSASEGVDIMFHEALDPEMVMTMRDVLTENDRVNLATVMNDILDYHATPEDAARAAAQANAGQLVYYHTVPPLPARLLYPYFLGDAPGEYDGKMMISEDGMIFSLPTGSDEVIVERAF